MDLDKIMQGDSSELEELRRKAAAGDEDAAEALKDIEGIFSFLNTEDSGDYEEDNPYDELCGEYYESFEALCEAAKAGDENAMDMEAAIYFRLGDIAEAIDAAMNILMQGHTKPLQNLAVQLLNTGDNEAMAMACNLFRAGAQMGDGFCAFNAGVCFHKALGTEANLELALEMFFEGALFGYEESYEKMEILCRELMGESGEEEYLKKVESLADKRQPGANMALYRFYIKEGENQNTDKALSCLFRACEGGSKLAAFELAMIVKEGRFGFIENPGRAMAIFQSLSEESPAACYELSMFYKDSQEEGAQEQAFMYMKKAFDMGYLKSVSALADFYMQGIGCPKDPRQAAMLMSILNQ